MEIQVSERDMMQILRAAVREIRKNQEAEKKREPAATGSRKDIKNNP